jgi:predicted MFS family arabinose efflux permease
MAIGRMRAGIALAVLCSTYLLSYMDRTVLSVLQEDIKRDFGLSDTQLGLLGGPAFAILYSLTGVGIARIAERVDRGKLIAICVAAWSAMTALCGMAQQYWHLLVTRAGVAIGEAGGNPTSHSLIADLYPPENRARAISFYTIGVPLGAFLGAAVGGLLARIYDWRTTFLILGAVGAVFTLATLALIPRVPRGTYDAQPAESETPPSAMDVLRVLGANRTFIHLAIGSSLVVLVGYSVPSFLVSFMMRVHGMEVAQAGLASGIVNGGGGLVGALSAGVLADWLAKKDPRWHGWMPGVAMLLSLPAQVLALLSGDPAWAIFGLTVGMALMFTYIPPSFAQIHGMVNARMRATATSVFYLIINLVGLGIGPPLVGWISDHLAAREMGADWSACGAATGELAERCGGAQAMGVQYALIAICFLLLWGSFHYWRAGIAIGLRHQEKSA